MHDARSVYNVFGKSSSLKTLTNSFVLDATVNNIMFFDEYREVTLQVKFTTGSATGEFVEVLVETSGDLGTELPTNFFIWSEDNYPNSSPATYLGAAGTPYRFPVDVATPGSATTYLRSYSFKVQARWLRISVRSTAAANFGSAWVQAWISKK